WGSGKPLREFLWSEDMADASVYIMESVNFTELANDKSEIRNCHINIGTGKEITIKALAELIQQTIGYTGVINWDITKPDGTMRKLTSVNKLHSLGWEHTIEIEQGVKQLYSWYLQ
ncbi:MAG: NAD-dependent epimerase/dehydratase family protein, partial [Bacteroidales bacterium]